MPDTKPGVVIGDEGVCSACRSVEKKRTIDWAERQKQLQDLCNEIRGKNGNGYDCIVPVSGGKDSFYQAWTMSSVYKLKVLCVIVTPHLQTAEGILNLNNLVEKLDVDLFKILIKPKTLQSIRRQAFFSKGEPNWADHCCVFAGVARVAYMYQVPLVVWGEDISVEFGGPGSQRAKASADDLMENELIGKTRVEDFLTPEVTSGDVFFFRPPEKEEMRRRRIRSIYLGYYHFWDGHKHYVHAAAQGFLARREGPLSGNVIDYDNIDEKLCEINIWFKFLKFGFWRPTDQCCYQIWNGRMSRSEAVALVNTKQYEFPGEYLKEFLEYHRISEKDFWETVEKYRNKEIWERVKGEWRLKVALA